MDDASKPNERDDRYELEPEADTAPITPPPPIAEGLEEAIDFELDREQNREEAPPQHAAEVGAPNTHEPVLVHTGWPNARVLGIAAAVLLVIAVVMSGVQAESRMIGHLALTAFNSVFHAATGLVAVIVAAMLLGRPVGTVELAAGRMAFAVAAFASLFHLDLTTAVGFEGMLIGAVVYVASVWVLFRFTRDELLVVLGAHFGLWLLVQVGQLLSAYVAVVPGG